MTVAVSNRNPLLPYGHTLRRESSGPTACVRAVLAARLRAGRTVGPCLLTIVPTVPGAAASPWPRSPCWRSPRRLRSPCACAVRKLDADELGLTRLRRPRAGLDESRRSPRTWSARAIPSGGAARLVITDRAFNVTLQVYRAGGETAWTSANDRMFGTPVSRVRRVGAVTAGASSGCASATGRAASTSCGSPPGGASATRRSSSRPRGSASTASRSSSRPRRGRRTTSATTTGTARPTAGTTTAHDARLAPRVPRPRRPAALQVLRRALPALGAPARRRPTTSRTPSCGRSRAATGCARAYRPAHLRGPPRVRDDARVRRGRAVPRPRRQPDVPVREQLLLADPIADGVMTRDGALARARPARGGADRRAVLPQRPRRAPRPVGRAGDRAAAPLAAAGDAAAVGERLASGGIEADGVAPARRPGRSSSRGSGTCSATAATRRCPTTRPRAARRSSPPARSRSRRASATRASRRLVGDPVGPPLARVTGWTAARHPPASGAGGHHSSSPASSVSANL